MNHCNFDFENESGMTLVVGLDEAGRGPLCGPVVAAATVFHDRHIHDMPLINDSKKMTVAQRRTAFEWLKNSEQVSWAVGICSAEEIDAMNILQASMEAMRRAAEALSFQTEFCLVDGNRMPSGLQGRAIVKGDSKSISIAAASIIAKEIRDGIMRGLAQEFPQYGWDRNAGYPTKEHLAAIAQHGITVHHRKTYGPVKSFYDC
jgi:ribonuclease HII